MRKEDKFELDPIEKDNVLCDTFWVICISCLFSGTAYPKNIFSVAFVCMSASGTYFDAHLLEIGNQYPEFIKF